HDPPQSILVDGKTYQRAEIYKHDSWAATSLYAAGDEKLIVKFQRQRVFLNIGLPGWFGPMVARRESWFLRALSDVDGVPRLAGDVLVDGRRADNAVARRFIPGRPLRHDMRVGRRFIEDLRGVLAEMHARGIAYVDLHKRENIIVGDDGQPYYIDFQLSMRLPNVWPLSLATRFLQRSDDYHLDKHVMKLRPDLLAEDGADIAARRPWWIKLHRMVGVPLRTLRRKLLVALGVRQGAGRAATEQFVEEALREERANVLPFPGTRTTHVAENSQSAKRKAA
ncbi:MAG: hypothetical protein KDA41_12210, partial [Planctomycetales bacterium]|nr:hypothetical protein [Planctomycetales bacterium]